MIPYVFVTLTVLWGPTPEPYVTAGPGFYDGGSRGVTLEPATLTWDPENGFGATSSVSYAPEIK